MQRTIHGALVAVAALVLLLIAAAANADESDRQEAGVSLDGRTYQEALEGPLFEDEVTWSPGQEKVSRFWVRGPADETGDLTIALDAGGIERLLESGRLRIAARAGGQSWRPVPADKALLLTDSPAADGVPVTVRVALAADAPDATKVSGSDFALRVNLGDTQVVGPIDVPDDPMAVGSGEAATWWVVPLGLILLSAGALLYGRREIASELR